MNSKTIALIVLGIVFFPLVPILLLFLPLLALRKGHIQRLVVMKWKVIGTVSNFNENNIEITGRDPGLVSWLQTMLGLDSTVGLQVNARNIEFTETSLSKKAHSIIPLENISSIYFTYIYPIFGTILIFCVFLFGALLAFGAGVGEMSSSWGDTTRAFGLMMLGVLVLALGVGLAGLYWKFNKRMELGFTEVSGMKSAISFQRSLIENVKVDETQAQIATAVIQQLLQQKRLSH